MRHQREPFGCTSRYMPRSSRSLYGSARGFAFWTAEGVNMAVTPAGA